MCEVRGKKRANANHSVIVAWCYIRCFLTDCVVSSAQVKVFVTGLFSLNQDIPAFKEHLRDFLVQIKVSPERNTCSVAAKAN